MPYTEDSFENLEKRLARIENHLDIKSESLKLSNSNLTKNYIDKDLNIEEINNKNQESFFNHILRNWPAKLGVFFILLGFGCLIGYALINDWLTELTFLFICLFASASLFLFGAYLLPKKKLQGEVLTSLGSAAIILSLWGLGISLISVTWIFILMLIVITMKLYITLKFKNKYLAFSSVILAMAIPLLVLSLDLSYKFLMPYIIAVDITALAGLLFYGWSMSFLIACIGTFLYQFVDILNSILVSFLYEIPFLLIFVFPWIIGVLYPKSVKIKLQNIFKALRLKDYKEIDLAAMFSSTGLAIVVISKLNLYLKISGFWSPFWKGIAFAGFGLISLVPLYFLAKKTSFSKSQVVLIKLLSCSSVFYFFNASFIEFEGALLNFVLFLEIWFGILLVYFLFNSLLATQFVAILFVIPIFSSASIIFPTASPFLSANFFILVFAIITTGSSLLILYRFKENKLIFQILLAIFAIYCLAMVCNICNNIFVSKELAKALCLVIYAFLGVMGIIFSKDTTLKKGSLLLILSVVVHLLLVEIWEMSTVLRIVTFLSVGMLLLLTAFINKKNKTPKLKDEMLG